MRSLRVHPTNPRWFADEVGRAVFLTGSHHWDSLVDNGERPGGFDYARYLDRLEGWGHNCVRLWSHEAWVHDLSHSPWARPGPGLAADGRPRYDLERFDEAYFARLRERVAAATARGNYVIVMLFNGWSLRDNGDGNPWPRHPFRAGNNVNGIDGDPGRRGNGDDVHGLRVPAVTDIQRRYVERVVEAVGDLDGVLWEVANESPGSSWEWQRQVLEWVRRCDAARGWSRPAGLTSCFPGGDNATLFESSAEWVSPNRHGGWMRTPPPNDSRKVVLLDTDHLWGIGGDAAWVWRSFLNGHQVLYMDPLDGEPKREEARRAMGVVRRLAERVELAGMVPRGELVSTRCSLASLPASGDTTELIACSSAPRLRLDLRRVAGPLVGEWMHPVREERVRIGALMTGGRLTLIAPWRGGAVLHLRSSHWGTPAITSVEPGV